ncbi:MAG: NUDIX hydrolase [Thaumarchaeota archaeon]|nr:NUDIX hydrolase [Nitrososphaerota archaeon]MCL5318536.1 NUDIX hydrolase [Nitrososphaerota archaeon]
MSKDAVKDEDWKRLEKHEAKEETVNTEIIHRGRNFTFEVRTMRLPSGKITARDIVEHPGAVAIIPLLDKNTVILVEQHRAAAGKTLLEIPAGTLQPPETPAECARRELTEETGYEAKTFKKLAGGYAAPGYSSEKIHIYLATDLTYTQQKPEEDEIITTRKIGLKTLKQMIRNQEIEDLKTIAAILQLLQMQNEKTRKT